MPKEIAEKLTWLFLLLPGFVCVSIAGFISEQPDWSEFQYVFYCLIASVAIAMLASPIPRWLSRGRGRVGMGPDTTTQLHFFVSIVLALLLGVAVGIAMQEDQLVSMIRTVPGGAALSKSSSKRPLLHVLSRNGNYRLDAEPALDQRPAPLRQKRAYVRIHLKEGLIYEGWPHQYSHGKASSEILLTPACRVSGDPPTAALLRGPGVVVMEPEIRAIEFLDLATSQCRHLVDAL